jgi:energy-coupling factor transporter transmembrane protein EcfT
MPLLIAFVVAIIVGYFISSFYLLVIGSILAVIAVVLWPATKGGLEALLPLVIVIFAVIFLVGGLIGHFGPGVIKSAPPVMKSESKSSDSINITEEDILLIKKLKKEGVI